MRRWRIAICITSPVSPGFEIDHLAAVGLVAAVLARASPGCGRSRPTASSTPLRAAHEDGNTASEGAHADHAAVLDDQILERRLGPDRDSTIDRDMQHLRDQRCAVGQQRLAAEAGGIGPSTTRAETVNAPMLRL